MGFIVMFNLPLKYSFDWRLLFGAWCFLIVVCVFGLYVCGEILFDHYLGLYESYREKRHRENGQNPGQTDNPPSGNFSKL